MKRLQSGLVVLAAGVVFAWAQPAEAQYAYVPYGGQSLSPWMNLFSHDAGPLDNYLLRVRPEIQLRETVQRQRANIQNQSAAIRFLGQQMTRIETGGPVRPTGTGSVFMNYSHYYQAPVSVNPRR